MAIFLSYFGQNILTEVLKKILIDNHYKIGYEPVRSDCSSYRA